MLKNDGDCNRSIKKIIFYNEIVIIITKFSKIMIKQKTVYRFCILLENKEKIIMQ